MKILVINSGSSSIKYKLFDMTGKTVLASGMLEQIGEGESRLTHQTRDLVGNTETLEKVGSIPNHREGIQLISSVLKESEELPAMEELSGIGHRVVHGGEEFQEPTVIDQEVIDTIRKLIPLAPLHNPANLLGIEVSFESAAAVPQVAVFDTAFHQSIPNHAFRYAIPEDLYKAYGVRRYGFHGTSHYYVAKEASRVLNRPLDSLNLITLHLGNGASATAIKEGKSVDTSMGMTPLEGLIMGTRSGDVDPAVIFYLQRQTGMGGDGIESILNKESGLKGICGVNDMRKIGELAEEGNPQAKLAVDMVCYRIKKYIGAYCAILGRLDALVFTGGVGENASFIRGGSCQGLSRLGIEVDSEKNNVRSIDAFEIQTSTSQVKVLVIPTNEELQIAEETALTLSRNV
jgi:acetate kinase